MWSLLLHFNTLKIGKNHFIHFLEADIRMTKKYVCLESNLSVALFKLPRIPDNSLTWGICCTAWEARGISWLIKITEDQRHFWVLLGVFVCVCVCKWGLLSCTRLSQRLFVILTWPQFFPFYWLWSSFGLGGLKVLIKCANCIVCSV